MSTAKAITRHQSCRSINRSHKTNAYQIFRPTSTHFDLAVPPYQEALRKAGTTTSSTITLNHLNEQKTEAETSHGTTHHLIQTFPQMWDKDF